MRIALSALVLIAACDRVYGLPERPVDASADACTLGDFNGAQVFPINGFPPGTFDPAMSADGLEMFYVVQSVSLDLRYATRPSVNEPWMVGNDLPMLNSVANDADPTVTADGRALLFSTMRDPQVPPRVVYEALREPGAGWGPPVRRLGIDVNAWAIDVSADGKALFVMEGDLSSSSLYRYERPDIGMDFVSRTEVGIGTRYPSISADESELFFHDADGIKREVNVNGAFVTPELVVPDEGDADLSHDGMILTFQTAGGLAYVKRGCEL